MVVLVYAASDVETQRLYQRANEPFVAVVIDPVKTTAQRRVEIGKECAIYSKDIAVLLGAFRTYEKTSSAPSGTAADGAARVVGNIPLDKVQDFGAHANSYYSLEVMLPYLGARNYVGSGRVSEVTIG